MGKAKRRRGALVAQEDSPGREANLAHVNGDLAFLGSLLSVALEQRGKLRAHGGRGRGPTRAEAIAAAVDHLLIGPQWERIQQRSRRSTDR